MEPVFSETSGSWTWSVGLNLADGEAEVRGVRSGQPAVTLRVNPMAATHLQGFSAGWLQFLIRMVAGHNVAAHFRHAVQRATDGK